MSIISINHRETMREQSFIDQIWGYIESPHQTICYDPALPLYCPPPLIRAMPLS
jgi:hypothetical protein